MFAYNSQKDEFKANESSSDEESKVKLKHDNISDRKTKVPEPGKASSTIEIEDAPSQRA